MSWNPRPFQAFGSIGYGAFFSNLPNHYSLPIFALLNHYVFYDAGFCYHPGVLCQKQVSKAGKSNYIPQYLWDVNTCPCTWYLLLEQHSWTENRGNYFMPTNLYIIFSMFYMKYIFEERSHKSSQTSLKRTSAMCGITLSSISGKKGYIFLSHRCALTVLGYMKVKRTGTFIALTVVIKHSSFNIMLHCVVHDIKKDKICSSRKMSILVLQKKDVIIRWKLVSHKQSDIIIWTQNFKDYFENQMLIT